MDSIKIFLKLSIKKVRKIIQNCNPAEINLLSGQLQIMTNNSYFSNLYAAYRRNTIPLFQKGKKINVKE